MQCTNCHFENLPGSAACGRCGTSMQLAGLALDVHPPRARGWRKWLRRVMPLGRAVERIRMLAAAARRCSIRLPASHPLLPLLVRLPLAGWPQIHLGQRIRGRLFLWSFLALLLPGALMTGTVLGSLLLGLAFSIHASAILDLMNYFAPRLGVRPQVVRSVLISIALLLLLYLPAARVVGLVADPRVMQQTVAPLEQGDVILVNHLSTPRVGDVVLYQMNRYEYTTVGPNGRGQIRYIYEGEQLDRIVAGPGDRVVWESGQLLVNGRPSPLWPLNVASLPERLVIDVPADHYLILPTTTANLTPQMDATVWKHLGCVRFSQIRGRAYLRTNPLSHFGRL